MIDEVDYIQGIKMNSPCNLSVDIPRPPVDNNRHIERPDPFEGTNIWYRHVMVTAAKIFGNVLFI